LKFSVFCMSGEASEHRNLVSHIITWRRTLVLLN
jgi:hypothetical protein